MYYYCRSVSPATKEDTNLQLYSLQKAAKNWNDLADSIEKQGVDDVYQIKERLVFILSCFGLSLVQLLGQNSPYPDKNMVDAPGKLLSNIIRGKVDQNTSRCLNKKFAEFLQYYDSLRHFGLNKHSTIDQLTVEKLDQFRRMTIKIWDVVIAIFKEDKNNDIQICSVVEAEDIFFKDLTTTLKSDGA
jgi:hypothetical protein